MIDTDAVRLVYKIAEEIYIRRLAGACSDLSFVGDIPVSTEGVLEAVRQRFTAEANFAFDAAISFVKVGNDIRRAMLEDAEESPS